MAWQAALISAGGAYLQNQQAKKASKTQMAFQERMSNTAIQRQMADMRKAGINPILAGKYGGASSPAGATYSPSNIGAAAMQGYQQYSSAKQMQAQSKVADAQVQQIKQQTKLTKANVKAVTQDTAFKRVLHTERWKRTFATMSPDNVAASVLATLNNVNIDQILGRFGTVQNRGALRQFLMDVAKQKSILFRETGGAYSIGQFIADILEGKSK
jgi:hypothetical protein